MAKTSSLRLRVHSTEAVADTNKLRKSIKQLTSGVRKLNTSLSKTSQRMNKTATATRKAASRAKTFQASGSKANNMLLIMIKRLVVLTALYAGLRAAFEGIDLAAGFGRQLSLIQAISKESAESVEKLRKSMVDLSVATGVSVNDLGEAAVILTRAGRSFSEIEGFTKKIADFSVISGTGIAESADAVIRTLAQFELGAENTGHVMEVLVRQSNAVRIDVTRMGQALKFVGPVAQSLGISLEEAAAAIGVLGQAGIDGTLAGTGLRGVLLSLQNPSRKAASAIRAMGLSADDVNPNMHSLTEVFENFRKVGVKASDLTLIFSKRQIGAAQVMLRSVDTMKKMKVENENVKDSLGDVAKAIRTDLKGQVDRLKTAWESLLISFGKSEVIKSLVGGLGDLLEMLKDIGVAIGAIDEDLSKLSVADREAAKIKKLSDEISALNRSLAALSSFDFNRNGPGQNGLSQEYTEQNKQLAQMKLRLNVLKSSSGRFQLDTVIPPQFNSVDDASAQNAALETTKKLQDEIVAKERLRKINAQRFLDVLGDIHKRLAAERELLKTSEIHQKAVTAATKERARLLEQNNKLTEGQFAALVDEYETDLQLRKNQERRVEVQKNLLALQVKASEQAAKNADSFKEFQQSLKDMVEIQKLSKDQQKAYSIALEFTNKLQGEAKDKAKAMLPALVSFALKALKAANAVKASREEMDKLGDAAKDAGRIISDTLSGLDQRISAFQMTTTELKVQNSLRTTLSQLEQAGVHLSAKQAAALQQQIAKRVIILQHLKDDAKFKKDSLKTEDEAARLNQEFADGLQQTLDAAHMTGIELEATNKAIEHRNQLMRAGVFVSDEQFESFKTMARGALEMVDAIERQKKAVEALKETYKELGEIVGNGIGSALESLIFDAKNFKDVMKQTINEVLRELFRVLVIKNIVAGVSSGISGIFTSNSAPTGNQSIGGAGIPNISTGSAPFNIAHGAAFNTSGHRMAASGFVANSPFNFTTAGGGRGRLGESGNEGVLPLKRVNGKLGVSAEGSSPTVVNQKINISTPNADSFHRSRRQIKDDIRDMSSGRRF